MPNSQLPPPLPPLPVDLALPELCSALNTHGRAILTASPGSGKTTRVPLALAGLLAPNSALPQLNGKIIVLEPRRLAARAAATYMAAMLGQQVGQQVGYRVRLENKTSGITKIEILTEGMFTRRILNDPELTGVAYVIFDEFHERSLQTDLGLALCLESIEAFRPDLRLLLMSATLKTTDLSAFLGGCPVITAEGRNYPVQINYTSPKLSVTPALRPDETAHKTALAVREKLQSENGSILVFLPGQGEIKRTAELLTALPANTDLYPLYGDMPLSEQAQAIAPAPPARRKVVLATDLAQTSLTIQGVRIVIDAGLSRNPRFEPATGLSRLVTTRLTKDAADQRAGRAGRLEAGSCLRLWPKAEQLLPEARPEILDTDLTSLFLDALVWGSNAEALPWLTPPPKAALQNAAETLLSLEAIEQGPNNRYRITLHGQNLARLPLHPRLAHMVLKAAELETGLAQLAACLAAIVSERDPMRKTSAANVSADIRLRLSLLKLPENKRIKNAAEQIYRLCGLKSAFKLPEAKYEDYSGLLLSLAWPERIAQRRSTGSFRLSSGQGAELPVHDPLVTEQWLSTATLGSGVNRRIHLAAPVSLADLQHVHGTKTVTETDIYWDSKTEAVVCRSATKLGALVLEETPLAPSEQLNASVQKTVLNAIAALGLSVLPWSNELRQLQARVIMLHNLEQKSADANVSEGSNNPWPDLSDNALLAGLTKPAELNWLAPWLAGVTRRSHFDSVDLGAALRALLPWPLLDRLEKEAPTKLNLPSGSFAAIDYLPVLKGEAPVLAVKLQEMFGQTASPQVAGGQVVLMLHLLSPAGRPLQVTADLQHFWANTYKDVRAEMRGRYPKHPWPENPLTAPPTGKTKKKFEATGQK
ncbi:ATP-dependent helicase HrpB [Desulfovibrio sp. OttesenSCG-928-F07]|nr:ATP-dependent helicase HrpB [Desulfovibrio sp. OttesenSCG-928-F07]